MPYICNKYATANQREPKLPHPVPSWPKEKVGIDYFTLAGKDYLLIVDYFSKYPEVLQMNSKTADVTIAKMKSIFARHGIPSTVVADNMPFGSRAFRQFAKRVEFQCSHLNPNLPPIKWACWEKCTEYQVTSEECSWGRKGWDDGTTWISKTVLQESLAQLLMSRRLRSSLPMTAMMFKPQVTVGAKAALECWQVKQKHYYDKTEIFART